MDRKEGFRQETYSIGSKHLKLGLREINKNLEEIH